MISPGVPKERNQATGVKSRNMPDSHILRTNMTLNSPKNYDMIFL